MVSIKDFGGEFAVIDMIKGILEKPGKDVEVGIGDDCAVVDFGGKKLVLTVDALVEGDHFGGWFSPEQAGRKAIEANVSDIASMGARPKFVLVGLCLRRDSEAGFVERLYNGINEACKKYGIFVIGGNITHGTQVVIDIFLLGELDGNARPCLRSSARPGDYIVSSGDLGGSCAGLNLFLKKFPGFEGVKKFHVEPHANLGKALLLAPLVNAMEDVSDGLASEVKNICKESNCGAVIFAENVPVASEVKKAASALGMGWLDFALFGGEDYELVATVPEKNVKAVEALGAVVVGRILEGKNVYLERSGKRVLLEKRGYDHFGK